ncbi:hypothetical protein [Lysobacter sp. CA199]|uniref:hypothetical protein n=1 Tax=Lysobacter sp. CA199 TaxID=3455608 RepID=UPI003F8D1FD6
MKPTDLIRPGTLSKAAVYFLLDGTTKPENIRQKTMTWLVSVLGVSREWLVTGRGPAYVEGEAASGYTDPAGERLEPLEAEELQMLELFRLVSPEMRAALIANAQASLAPPPKQSAADLIRRVNPKHRERLKAMGVLHDATSATAPQEAQSPANRPATKAQRD